MSNCRPRSGAKQPAGHQCRDSAGVRRRFGGPTATTGPAATTTGSPARATSAGHAAFADLYRDETAGLIAVDGSHPDQWVRWPTPYADRILRTANRVTAALAWFGLLRVVDLSAGVSAGDPTGMLSP